MKHVSKRKSQSPERSFRSRPFDTLLVGVVVGHGKKSQSPERSFRSRLKLAANLGTVGERSRNPLSGLSGRNLFQ